MSPEETRRDAVEAAHEWRDQQLERIAAHIAEHLPARGERFEIVWPGGPHNFAMKFMYEDNKMAGAPDGWTFLHGQVVEPEAWHGRPWSFMVHWVAGADGEGAWTMLPHGGKLSDVQP